MRHTEGTRKTRKGENFYAAVGIDNDACVGVDEIDKIVAENWNWKNARTSIQTPGNNSNLTCKRLADCS